MVGATPQTPLGRGLLPRSRSSIVWGRSLQRGFGQSPIGIWGRKPLRDLGHSPNGVWGGVPPPLATPLQEEKRYLEDIDHKTVAYLTLFKKPEYRKPLLIAVLIQFGLQSSIFLSVIYSTILIQVAGFQPHSASVATVGIGVVKFLSGFITTAVIDFFHRRTLILFGSACCSIALAVATVAYFCHEVLARQWLHLPAATVIGCLAIFNFVYSLVSAAGSLVCVEMFLQESRAKTGVVINSTSWFIGFLAPLLFFPFFTAVGPAISMLPVVVILLFVTVTLWKFLPETSDLTFLQINEITNRLINERGTNEITESTRLTHGPPNQDFS